MITWFHIGIIAAILTTFGFVPQIIKMYRTRSVGDVSLFTLLQFSLGVTLWIFYGISIDDPIVTTANMVTLGTLIIAVSIYVLYTRPAGRS